jgi:hypothetical protein
MLRLYVYPRNNKPHGKVNDMPNANSLIKYSHPLYVLGMSKAVRDQTGKGPGDTIEVVVWKDEVERIVEVPAQFENLMKKEVFKKTELHPSQGVLPLDCRSQEGRNTIEEIRESH